MNELFVTSYHETEYLALIIITVLYLISIMIISKGLNIYELVLSQQRIFKLIGAQLNNLESKWKEKSYWETM